MFREEGEDLDNLTKFLEEDCVEEEDTLESLLDDLKKEKRNSIDDLLAEIDEISIDSSQNRKEETKQKVKKHSTDASKPVPTMNVVDKLLAETDIEENVDLKREEKPKEETLDFEDALPLEDQLSSSKSKDDDSKDGTEIINIPLLNDSVERSDSIKVDKTLTNSRIETTTTIEKKTETTDETQRKIEPRTSRRVLQGVFGCMCTSPIRAMQRSNKSSSSSSIFSQFRNLFSSPSKKFTSEKPSPSKTSSSQSYNTASTKVTLWRPLLQLFEEKTRPNSEQIHSTIERIVKKSNIVPDNVIAKLFETLENSLKSLSTEVHDMKDIAKHIKETSPDIACRALAVKHILKSFPSYKTPCPSLNWFLFVVSASVATGHGVRDKAKRKLETVQDLVFGTSFRCERDAIQILNPHTKRFLLAVKCSSSSVPECEVVCRKDDMMMNSLDFSSSSFEKTIWIKPFFESTFGVKTKTRSNGSIAAVEEGEGHGPRKRVLSFDWRTIT